jgi:SnoaL-like domain
MSGTVSADAIASLLRALVLDVFDEHDPDKRAAAIERVFTADCEFSDPYGAYRGYAQIEQVVLNLHANFRGFRFHLTSEPQAIVNGGRITWSSGPPEAPATLRGTDVAMMRDGRIAVLLTFMDPPDGTALSR